MKRATNIGMKGTLINVRMLFSKVKSSSFEVVVS